MTYCFPRKGRAGHREVGQEGLRVLRPVLQMGCGSLDAKDV